MKTPDEKTLGVMADYCRNAIELTEGLAFEDFFSDVFRQHACAFEILQIGESAKRLSEGFKDEHAEIPWKQVLGMRNVLTHDYGSIDVWTMWETAKNDLPFLLGFCRSLSGRSVPDDPEL